MTKNLKWRLKDLPTSEELIKLVDAGIIKAEEAKAILTTEQDGRDTKSLKEEILFLRKVVDELSKKNNGSYTVIKELAPSPLTSPWFGSYTITSGDAGEVTFYNCSAINNF